MDRSLHETVKAVKGLVVMSPELEAVVRSMYDNQVCVLRVCMSVCACACACCVCVRVHVSVRVRTCAYVWLHAFNMKGAACNSIIKML